MTCFYVFKPNAVLSSKSPSKLSPRHEDSCLVQIHMNIGTVIALDLKCFNWFNESSIRLSPSLLVRLCQYFSFSCVLFVFHFFIPILSLSPLLPFHQSSMSGFVYVVKSTVFTLGASVYLCLYMCLWNSSSPMSPKKVFLVLPCQDFWTSG